MNAFIRFAVVCVSLVLGGCFTVMYPNHAGCSGYTSIGDRLACREGRNDAFASQMQRTYELQQIREHNVREAARSGVRYDAVKDEYHATINCKDVGADAAACWQGIEQGKTEALGEWQDTIDQHRDNVREREFLKAGGISRYGYR